jgi:hypothetical protein
MNRVALVSVLAASCALVLLTSSLVSQKVELASVEAKSQSDFQEVWGDWIGRVTREVKAAVDISHGLSPEKKESLNGLLSEDMVSSMVCFFCWQYRKFCLAIK